MKHHEIEQNTPEWLKLRAGKITGSAVKAIMVVPRSGVFNQQAQDYAYNIITEQETGLSLADLYPMTSMDMQRGHDEEPIARALYEEMTFSTVEDGGFFEDGILGCSPDGLVGDDGVIEIKAPRPHKHLPFKLKDTYNPDYKWQLAFNLKVSDREWIDYISYCSAFPVESENQIHIKRLTKDDFKKEFEKIDERIELFVNFMEEIKQGLKAA